MDAQPPIIFRPRLFHEISYDSYASSLEEDQRLHKKKDRLEKHTYLSSKDKRNTASWIPSAHNLLRRVKIYLIEIQQVKVEC